MGKKTRENNGFGTTKAIHHKLNDIEIFQVTAEQLDEIKKNSSSDLFLEIALCLISIFGSFLCSLLVVDFITYPKAYNTFLIVCCVTGLTSIIMFLLWWRTRQDKTQIIDKIKQQPVEE